MRIIVKFFTLIILLPYILIASSCNKSPGCICNDGHLSHSSGSGTCSWHGGIDHYVDTKEIDVIDTIWLVAILGFTAYVIIGITIVDIKEKRRKTRLAKKV